MAISEAARHAQSALRVESNALSTLHGGPRPITDAVLDYHMACKCWLRAAIETLRWGLS